MATLMDAAALASPAYDAQSNRARAGFCDFRKVAGCLTGAHLGCSSRRLSSLVVRANEGPKSAGHKAALHAVERGLKSEGTFRGSVTSETLSIARGCVRELQSEALGSQVPQKVKYGRTGYPDTVVTGKNIISPEINGKMITSDHLKSELVDTALVTERGFVPAAGIGKMLLPQGISVGLKTFGMQVANSGNFGIPSTSMNALSMLANALRKLLPLLVVSVAAGVIQPRRAFASAGVAAGNVVHKHGSEALASAWAGLVAGCLHTLTGPDHLAALAPLCIGRSSKLESAAIGALWGCGHDAGQLLFGIAFLLLKERLHIEVLRTWGARVVGVTLILIGAVGIKEAQEVPVVVTGVVDTNKEADSEPFIYPVPIEPGLPGPGTGPGPGRPGLEQGKKSLGLTFATGVVYGLQPDALLMVLPALAMPSRFAGVCFLCMFLLGTVVAMGSYTVFLGSCSEALHKRLPWITQRLSFTSSLIAIGFGFAALCSDFFGITLF